MSKGSPHAPWSRPLADLVDAAIDPVLARQGFGESQIVLYWEDIVGERLAAGSEPLALQWPPRGAARTGHAPPTLVIRVESGFALELQHLAATVIERVNGYLGFACIDRLALRQGPLTRQSAAKRPRRTPSPDAIARRQVRRPKVKDNIKGIVEGSIVDLSRFPDNTFDAVTCLFSSIGYVRTKANLHKAVKSMARHLREGGVLLVEPWFNAEQWDISHPRSLHADSQDLKITRMSLGGKKGNISTLDFHYLVGTPERIEYFTEHHELGLFSHTDYMNAFRTARLEVSHDKKGLDGRGLYIGRKPLR